MDECKNAAEARLVNRVTDRNNTIPISNLDEGGDLERNWKTITNWKKGGWTQEKIKYQKKTLKGVKTKTNQLYIKDNNKISQADLEKPDIEWERAQGKSVNVLFGRKAEVEIEKTKTIQKKQLILECSPSCYQLKEMEKKLATGEELAIDNVSPSCFSFFWWHKTTTTK